MSENSQIQPCSRCGATVVPDALRGLCPRCFLALNLATQTDLFGDDIGPLLVKNLRGKMRRLIGGEAFLPFEPPAGGRPIFILADGEAPIVAVERLKARNRVTTVPRFLRTG